ncbi:MAG TPA: hypothetical protein VN903_31980 [Polyangia bacterium]|nr:hypothetical protein [Polyangia bacterium]
MRIERIALGFGLALAASACGSILQAPDGGSDARGHDGGGAACHDLDEAACRARTDCTAGICYAICGNGSTFTGCYDPASETPPPCAGLAIPCQPPCTSVTDEASCKARPDCTPSYCPNCGGGSYYSGCSSADNPTNTCPAIACPLPCSQMMTQETCDTRPDCHPVFVDNRSCACAALGCCAKFSRCADGATAVCKAPSIVCDALTPYCEGPYVVSYTNSCYEGCVLSTDCAAN